ncbi:PepSY domain-containing protein [Methanocaldococcus sp. 16A]
MEFKKFFAILLSIALLGVGAVFATTYTQTTTLNSEDSSENVILAKYAKISEEDAKSIALSKVPGKVVKVELENEDGNIVYGVEISTSNGIKDVKVDAKNGEILKIEDGNEKENEIENDKETNDDKTDNDKETNDDNIQEENNDSINEQ